MAGIPDLEEDVAGKENVTKIEPEPCECAWDKYRAIALPNISIRVPRQAMGIATDVGVERAQHAVWTDAEETTV